MGDRLTGEEESEQASPKTYGDIFDEFLPEYLAIGMPYDLYWDGEYGTKTAYRKAYQLRIRNEQLLADTNNWYVGQYIMAALQAVPLLVNGFVPKGVKAVDYPDKPFLEKQEELKKEEARQKHEEDQSKIAQAMFQAMVAKFNKNIEKRLEREAQEGTGQ